MCLDAVRFDLVTLSLKVWNCVQRRDPAASIAFSFFSFHRFLVGRQVVLPYPFAQINTITERVYRIYLENSPRRHNIEVKSIDEVGWFPSLSVAFPLRRHNFIGTI